MNRLVAFVIAVCSFGCGIANDSQEACQLVYRLVGSVCCPIGVHQRIAGRPEQCETVDLLARSKPPRARGLGTRLQLTPETGPRLKGVVSTSLLRRTS
jgi:hypothetical protein